MRRLAAVALMAALARVLGCAAPAWADLTSQAFLRMPSRFMTTELTLSSRALGEICYSRDLMPDGSVCNPAFSDEARAGFLMGRVYLGNGYAALNSANQLLFKPVSREFLQDLFSRGNVTALEANLSLVFATQYFSASFSPYRVQYFSEIHNPNFAVIAIQAAVESALEFQGGSSLGGVAPVLKDLSWGARMRILKRSYVSGTFSMAQTLVEEPKALLPVKEQYAFYLDPTVGWRPSIGKWRFWASAGLVNVGKASNEDPLYHAPLDVSAGVGAEAPIRYGRLRLGLDTVTLISGSADPLSIPRLGGSYQLGIMETMAGWNQNAVTGGFLFAFQVIQAGIVYEFLRSELNGGFSENRISTEVSIKL